MYNTELTHGIVRTAVAARMMIKIIIEVTIRFVH